MSAYPYPEKKGYLKRILKENKVDQEKDNSGPTEPEMIIWRSNYQFPFYGYMFLSNLIGQLGNYMLQLSAHRK